jgi:SlyX protein
MLAARLIEIETKLAFQEDTIQSLNAVVCQQQKQIEQLQATVELLIDRYRQLSAAADVGDQPVHEIPPHY